MSSFYEYVPETGITRLFDYDEAEGQAIIHSRQDVEPLINYCTALRNEEGVSRRGIKESWWLYAKIPPIVVLLLRKKGIDVFNKDHEARVYREIDENFPYLKTTTGRHRFKDA